ncbi:MAG TPA: cytochrome c [Candidatus Elarobacter sp.]|nr:cytochrome c [Candidatus Elarobacter sp.]
MTKIAFAVVMTTAVLTGAAAPAANAAPPRSSAAGQKVFASNCTGCHGATGMGVPGLFPSLVANPYVSGDAKRVIHTVKFGLIGKIVVKGKTYNGVMPSWTGTLTDTEIADVITYVRTNLKNKSTPVTVAQVRAVTK